MGGYTWFGLGTMLISEGARLKGSRFSNSLYAYCMLMVSWMRVAVEEVEEAAELAWRARAFITQPFVMEPVVVFILVICLGLAHPCRPTEGPWLKEVEKNLVEITSHGQMKWTLHYSRSLLSITTMAIMPRMNGSPMSIVLL
ncbi:uncharacterized protein LOC119284882 isoform X1 [Triticum dicoccoides]|uniref:uncharacterized protein LOC119284882 isoform X1 n=1 Tax=Triticum dicoccoides TaxID=85692 RepID=UPI00188FA3E9|nr:uncharacterized protein LOC119284882 isoform X1 [Triticum dicoccoides]